MATRGAELDRRQAGSPADKPRRAAAKAPARRRQGKAPEPAGGAWGRSLRAGMIAMLLGGLAAAVGAHLAGHAPSWRSLTVVLLQSVPLLPGMALFWRVLEWLKGRYTGLPMTLWLAVVLLGATLTMLVSSGIVFAIHNRVLAFGEDTGGQMRVIHHLIGIGGALYLYATTAFRLWWPFGAAVPAAMALLFWRTHRR